jgi:hypothetical protein
MRDEKDRSSKWLIEHHGNAILLLAGLTGVRSWRTAAAELVAPKQLPDGLLEVFFEGREQADLFLLEIATYPEHRAEEQAVRDVFLVLLDRGVLPEMLTLVLHPKGKLTIGGQVEQSSRLGFTRLGFKWEVLELWKLSAKALLASDDVGVVPWLLLTQFDGPEEAMARQCRERIERLAKPEERDRLLAVTRILARLRYNDPGLLDLLITRQAMIESPEIQEIMNEVRQQTTHANIVRVLEGRLGPVPPALAARIRNIADDSLLQNLLLQAALCAAFQAFQAALPA